MTVTFELNAGRLTIKGLTHDPEPRLSLDDSGSPAFSRDGAALHVTLPLAVFDGRPHTLSVAAGAGKGKTSGNWTHASRYTGALTAADDTISGRVCDLTRPNTPIELDIDIDGITRETVMTDAEGAFELPNPAANDSRDGHVLSIRVRGTTYQPLGAWLVRISAAGIMQALSGDLPQDRRQALESFARAFVLTAARSEAARPLPAFWRLSEPSHTDTVSDGVDVIVPVYRGKAETLACIDSVLKAQVKTRYNLIVINDCSPDAALTAALKGHAAKHGYRLLENAENLGFVKTVNRGMTLNDDNDVVLLNADTEVSDFWLDRLVDAAYSAPRIASVTPLSNNATILSLPTIKGSEALPYGLDLKGVNALLARENAGLRIDLPTAHGFCMFIRRAALREVGTFDAETFGRGYGEENDFSMRAATRGWRHLAACDALVYHKGAVSFGDKADLVATNLELLARTYPDYSAHVHRFIDDDPMAAVRNRVQKALWRNGPNVVFLSLATGGGVDTNIDFLARKLIDEGFRVLVAKRSSVDPYAYAMTEWGTSNALYYPKLAGIDGLCADILTLEPQFVHVHHLIDMEDGLDRFLVASGIPYYITLHDYFYLCPRVTLLDDGGEYGEAPVEPAACNACLKRGGAHRDIDPSYNAIWPDITAWRDKWHDLLKHAQLLIAPSQAAADIYNRIFVDLPLEVHSHQGPAAPTIQSETVPAPDRITVALLGGLGAHKGYNEVIALLRWAEKREPKLRFALIGYSDHIDLIRSFPNLDDLGPYTADTLEAKIRQSGAQVALFLSQWPETYVYTLSEALNHGLTPVANDLGAPASRLRALGVGELVEPGASHATIVKAIKAAARTKITPKTYSEGQYESIINDYYQFGRVHDDHRVGSLLLPKTEGLTADRWAGNEVRLDFATRGPVNRLKIDLYIPEDFGPQQVRVHIAGEDYGLLHLPAEGSARRIDVATRPLRGLIPVRLEFSFAHRLPKPDERMGAAKLGAVSFEFSREPVAEARPNPLSPRLRPTPDVADVSLEEAAEIDSSGRLEEIYRTVAGYTLFQQKPSLMTEAKGLAKDILWSARVGRRQGPKKALKSFAAMRALRRSAFDDTFYRMQLGANERRLMDPVNHYVVFGDKEGYDPVPGFSTEFYLQAHDDLKRAGINPFYHYLRHGVRENRRIEPSAKIGLFLEARMRFSGSNADRLSGAHLLIGGAAGSPGGGVWPKRERPGLELSRFDIRPDDDVLDVAWLGKTFLDAHGLLGKSPKWEQAVKALNALPRPSLSETPDVSIIIPVYGQLAYTLNCLDSLLRHSAGKTFEILIGDDASPDDSEKWLSQVHGVRHIRHATNQGFIVNCNETAKQARGKFLTFLNNDTRVGEGWLDRMLESFNHFPKAGIVGSKLYYPDGSLQEAGGIVWKDGSAWNYGRNDDPNRPAYCYARAVDYVSGASFTITKDLWDRLDGFDERYKPAYYEDTDLAFRVRELDYSVIMQPLSKVVHYEGKTSGTDLESGAKAYQVANKEKFFARWEDVLETHRDNGDQPSLERDRWVKHRVLVLDACNPTPDQDAGSKATIDLMRYYQALGYHVSFVPEDNFLYERAQVQAMQATGIECFYAPFDTSVTDLLATNGPLYDVVHVIRASVGARNIELVRKHAPQAKVLYLNADLHYLRMERQADIENNDALREEAKAMKAKELALANAVDITLVHSEVERDILHREAPDAAVAVLPLIEAVVDTTLPYMARKDIMFLGGYNHTPNVDAARFLLDELWPKLAAELPEAKLLLVGAHPPKELLERASERIMVPGKVDDLTSWFDRSRLFIAPLRYGAGAKGKVLAALAHGVPVIATPIAAEGMPMEDGQTVFIGDGADALVAETLRLYRISAREWNRHSLDAQDYIQEHHSFAAGLEVMQAVLETV